MNCCKKLAKIIEDRPDLFFNVSGGCGVIGGTGACMSSVGIWFSFCPFCGREIVSEHIHNRWIWYEKETDVSQNHKLAKVTLDLEKALQAISTPQEYKLVMQCIPEYKGD